MPVIKQRKGLQVRFGNDPGWLHHGAAAPRTEVATLDLEIREEPDGFFLVSSSDHDHFIGGDSWHQTLEDALRQAEAQFGVPPSEWVEPC